MAIRKPGTFKKQEPTYYIDESTGNEPWNQQDLNTSFTLRSITFEDIDQAVWENFNDRFFIHEKNMKLLIGDSETTSLIMNNFDTYDKKKGFLAWPFFVYTRTESNKLFKTNPASKQVVYTIPKKKEQGIVIEEYITEASIQWELKYDFKFVSYYREECNDMELQMNEYFRNKRNIINLGGNQFSISPASEEGWSTMEMVNRDNANDTTTYVMTFKLKLWCWTRNSENMIKRERPNSYSLSINVTDDPDLGKDPTQRRKSKTFITATDSLNMNIVNKTKPDDITDPGVS